MTNTPHEEERDEDDVTYSLANAFMHQFVALDFATQKDHNTLIPKVNPQHEVKFLNREDGAGMEVYVNNEFLGEVEYADNDCTPKLIVMTREIFGE